MSQKIRSTIISSLSSVGIPVLGVIISCLVGAVIVNIMGYSAWDAYSALIKGALGSWPAVTVTVSRAVPLILIGLAVAIARNAGILTIGCEGQLMMGAITAVIVGHYVTGLPHILHVTITIAASMVAGMLWVAIPAVLRVKRNINFVFSTIMFNHIASYFLMFCVTGFLKDPVSENSVRVQDTARLTKLVKAPGVMNTGVIIVAVTVVLFTVFMYKTVLGYEIRAMGQNSNAAISAGISRNKTLLVALMLSGVLSGLCGGIEVTGQLGRLFLSYSPGYGFRGITVCLLARNNPFGIVLAGLFFGVLYNGATNMQSSVGMPVSIIDVIQGLIIIFVCLEYLYKYIIQNWIQRGKKHGV
jgi:ABC-type uncharacterized transport system permease subunit